MPWLRLSWVCNGGGRQDSLGFSFFFKARPVLSVVATVGSPQWAVRPGSIIGAASLLTGQPCENVIAAEEVVAMYFRMTCAIYDSEPSFRDWCDLQLWPQIAEPA